MEGRDRSRGSRIGAHQRVWHRGRRGGRRGLGRGDRRRHGLRRRQGGTDRNGCRRGGGSRLRHHEEELSGAAMKTWTQASVGLVVPMLLWAGVAFGQAANPPAKTPAAPQTVEGQVVKIDRAKGLVTIRSSDGTMHEF